MPRKKLSEKKCGGHSRKGPGCEGGPVAGDLKKGGGGWINHYNRAEKRSDNYLWETLETFFATKTLKLWMGMKRS